MRSRRPPVVPLIAVLIAACSAGASPSVSSAPGSPSGSQAASQPASGAAGGELQVYGAASLKATLATVKEAYESSHPGTTLTISTDSSAALETKIEQGAPADVFLSADTTNPQKLVDKGLASGSGVTTFGRNLLTVIVPSANPGGIASPRDLARSGVKIIGAGDSVPITRYATQLVGNLAKQSGYPANFVTAYASNVVSKEDSVAGVVSKVALGEGDAGIVYVTDAKTSPRVKTIDVPADANVPATYGGVVVKASQHQDAASQFLTWLAGSDGQAILATFGFLPPG